MMKMYGSPRKDDSPHMVEVKKNDQNLIDVVNKYSF